LKYLHVTKNRFTKANQSGFRNPWAATPARQPVATSGIGRNFGEVKY
jgi:hypothetical protein